MQWAQQLEALKANLLALGARKLAALGVLGIVTMLLVGVVGYYSSRAETEPLYVGLGQADVSRMGSTLQAAGVSFDVSADGTKVLVRKADAPRARMLLAEKGLPSGATAGYELFDKLGPLGLTSFMQEVTRTRALEGELARTIQTMKGINWARVHVVYPDSNSFRRNRQQATASVIVRLDGLRQGSAPLVIRHLVAAAVPGLSPEHVSVMSTDGSILAASGDAGGAGPAKLIELERTVSTQLQDSIRRTLAPYLGVENFEVTVAAQLNFDKRQQNEQVFDPEKKAERSTRVVKEIGSSQNNVARQAASVEQNIPAEGDGKGAGDQSRKNNERREELTNFEINSRTVATTSEGHRIESINVAVVLNKKRLVASLGGTADAQAIDQQVKKIEAVVGAAAGINAARGDKLSVATFDFSEQPMDGAGKLGIIDTLMLHLDRFIIAMTALAGIAIFIWLGLLPAVRTISTQAIAARQVTVLAAGGAASLAAPAGAAALPEPQPVALGLPTPAMTGTQRKLSDLIERDEKQVAMILKQWMAKE